MTSGFFPVGAVAAPATTLAASLRAADHLRARISAAIANKPLSLKRKKRETPPAEAARTERLFAAIARFRIAAMRVTCGGRELPSDAHLTRLLCVLKLAKGRALPSAEVSRLGLALTDKEEKEGKDGFSAPRAFKAAQKLLESFPAVSDGMVLVHDETQNTYRLQDPGNVIQIKKPPKDEMPPRPITFFGELLTFERPEHHKILETLLINVDKGVDLNGAIKSRMAPFGNLTPSALYHEIRKIMRMLEKLRPPELPSVYLTRKGTVYRLVDRAGDLKFANAVGGKATSPKGTPPHRPAAPNAADTVFFYAETPFTLDDDRHVTILKKLLEHPERDIDLLGQIASRKMNSNAHLGASSIYAAVCKINQKLKQAKRPDISTVFIGRNDGGNGATYFLYDPQGHITIAPTAPAHTAPSSPRP
jgi:hypothetical protein